MAKLRLYRAIWLLALTVGWISAVAQYKLQVLCVDRDSVFNQGNLGIPTQFKTRLACTQYIFQLPGMLQAKGFAAASLDSTTYDSVHATVHLYIGDNFSWSHLQTKRDDAMILGAVGWNEKKFLGKPINFQTIQHTQQLILDYLENNGYPFSRIALDSIVITDGKLSAKLVIDKGPLYRIDSIRIFGEAKISVDFLQRYLNIPNGSIYRKDRLQAISRKIMELPYVQEQQSWTLTLLGNGSILNLYLKPKKSSQIDALIGFLPNNNQLTSNKLLVTGQATVNLKNTLGNGESFGLNWQQMQVKSPALNLYFQQPYIFKSPFGLNTSFDLFKKDSSYLNINLMLGVLYANTSTRSGSVFLQSTTSNLLTIDTLQVIATHQLPSEADLSSVNLGISFEFVNTNYRFNPLRGNEFQITGSAGTKTIRKNSQILKLVDPNDSSFSFNSLYDTLKLNSYEFRVKAAAAHYLQLSRASTLKLAFNFGVFASASTFRNEVFQIGGYRLLRGFDEESILAAQYTVASFEYRYLIAQNSYLFSFLDLGWARNDIPGYSLNNSYGGIGLGLAFETKAGIFNMSYAVGKRNDQNLNLRQAKIHLGYVAFF